MESTPVSRASLETRCGGIRLQSCPSTLSLDAVGLVFLFFTSAEWQSQRAMPTTFFLCFSQDSYGMPVKILGKWMTLNPVAIFLSFLFWGWLWGVPGMLLAVPILSTI
jgi:predicted PurR-regulated permease PerM